MISAASERTSRRGSRRKKGTLAITSTATATPNSQSTNPWSSNCTQSTPMRRASVKSTRAHSTS